MRILKTLLNLATLSVLAFGTAASADQAYTTATGENVDVLDIFRDCKACPEMVVLPMGSFTMGSTEQEAIDAHRRFFLNQNIDPDQVDAAARKYLISRGIDPDKDPARSVNPFLYEVPAHHVSIDLPIAIGRNEVTREEWDACVKDGGCAQGLRDMPRASWASCLQSKGCVLTPDDRLRFRLPDGPHPTHPRAPRTAITYPEMLDYTSWLNKKVGANVYRLPTEPEWEFAAKSGTNTRFAQGQTLSLEQANFLVSWRKSADGKQVWDYERGSPRKLLPVDRLDAANAWGIRHMSGNASEFTGSCGSGQHRGLTSSSQYLAADSDRHCKRAVKGGMYNGNVELARPARRVAISEDHWSASIGFRVVRDMTPAAE